MGGRGADQLAGGVGKDRIYPGRGTDHVWGGPGDDSILVEPDGQRDYIDCGAGNDVVLIAGEFDRHDKFVDCEALILATP